MNVAFSSEMQIHERLRQVRERSGKTQPDFAASVGVSMGAYKNYEAGTRDLPVGMIQQLYERYRVDPKWLLIGAQTTDALEQYEIAVKAAVTAVREHLNRTGRNMPAESEANLVWVIFQYIQAHGSSDKNMIKSILGV